MDIKFGDFGPELVDVYSGDSECVELPSSWIITKKVQKPAPKSNGHFTEAEAVNSVTEEVVPTTEAKQSSENDVPDCSAGDHVQESEAVLNGSASIVNGVNSIEVETSTSVVNDDDEEDDVEEIDTTENGQVNLDSIPDPSAHAQEADSTESKDSSSDVVAAENTTDTTNSSSENEPKNTDEQKSAPKVGSWAALFRPKSNVQSNTKPIKNNSAEAVHKAKPALKVEPVAETVEVPTTIESKISNQKTEPEPVSYSNNNHIRAKDDTFALHLAETLNSQELIYKPQAFVPRGFANSSNCCFINATLQALLVCPPLYQLMKNTPLSPREERPKSSTPFIDSFVQLVQEFRQLMVKKGFQSNREIPQDPPFEPACIYNMLADTNPTLFEKGAQGDAEEFLNCVLNGLHEEMKQLAIYLVQEQRSSQNGFSYYAHENESSPSAGEFGQTPATDDWEEVTKKNRSTVTRRADVTRSHISDMFRGVLSCTVFRQGAKPKVIHENFFCLPIDVQTHRTVEEALASLTVKEHFNDGGDSKGPTSRHQTVETLPPVLILHLKRFVYKNGQPFKLDQELEFKTDLIIDKEVLSKQAKKLRLNKRSYKLFAVVNHHGENSTNGHYSTDVFHIGLSTWLRMDDKAIRPVRNIEVTKHNKLRSAYLLFYRRTDLG